MRNILTIICFLFLSTQIYSQTVGLSVKGNFDGSGQSLTATGVMVKQGKGNPVEGGTKSEFDVVFSPATLLPIEVGCCDVRLINEGDLLNNGRDCISVFSAPANGCTYQFSTYCYVNGKWQLLFEPFLVATACEGVSDATLQATVYRTDKGAVVYTNDKGFRVYPKKLEVK